MSEPEQSSTTPSASSLSREELTKALKAFKKRPKLTQLDFDSRIGASPLSGHASGIVAISPPHQYPREVWEALVEQGKLKRVSCYPSEWKKRHCDNSGTRPASRRLL